MKSFQAILLCVLSFLTMDTKGQVVNILVDELNDQTPSSTIIESAYLSQGFTNVNITRAEVDSKIDNYDVVYISEFNSTNDNFITSAQYNHIFNYVNNGGHVVWNAESDINWSDFPPNGGPLPENYALNLANHLLGNGQIEYGEFVINSGGAFPLPAAHNNIGSGGLLENVSEIESSGSYASLLNVPSANQLFGTNSVDFFG